MVYVMMAEGFEEIEALAVVDVMRRVGIDVFTVSITDQTTVTGAHKIQIIADLTIKEAAFEDVDMIVLPGGMPGAQNLYENPVLEKALEKQAKNKKWIAAICAAPFILGKRGYLEGEEAICYPGFEKDLKGAIIKNQSVVISDNFITSKGPGTALHFAFAIVSVIKDQETALELAKQMQVQWEG